MISSPSIADRVRETTTTTGTGTITLAGAVPGFISFNTAFPGTSTQVYYTISAVSPGEWETGIGTFTNSGTTLSRTTVLSSSNGGSLVNFSAGTKDVFVTLPASPARDLLTFKNIPGRYALASSGSTLQQYLRVGTWTAGQAGQIIKIKIFTHTGYNATDSQDQIVDLYFKTSNSSSVNVNGFAGNAWHMSWGESNVAFLGGAWVANAAGTSATSFTLYINMAWYNENSFYEVSCSDGTTWLNDPADGQSDPGAASSTVCWSAPKLLSFGSVVLTAANYNSYAPTLTGTGASGTWGINVTGSAGSVPWSGVSSKPTSLSGYGISDFILQYLSPSTDLNTVTTSGIYRIHTGHANSPGSYGQMLVMHGAADTITQIYGHYADGTLYTRSGNPPDVGGSGSWSAWRTLLADHNYTTYTVTKTGGGASGTWSINITGVANGVGTVDPALGTGGMWVTSAVGLNVARNGTAYVVVDSGNVSSYAATTSSVIDAAAIARFAFLGT